MQKTCGGTTDENRQITNNYEITYSPMCILYANMNPSVLHCMHSKSHSIISILGSRLY